MANTAQVRHCEVSRTHRPSPTLSQPLPLSPTWRVVPRDVVQAVVPRDHGAVVVHSERVADSEAGVRATAVGIWEAAVGVGAVPRRRWAVVAPALERMCLPLPTHGRAVAAAAASAAACRLARREVAERAFQSFPLSSTLRHAARVGCRITPVTHPFHYRPSGSRQNAAHCGVVDGDVRRSRH